MSARPCVVLTRAPDDNLPLAQALGARGVPVRQIPCTDTRLRACPAPDVPFAAVAFASRRGVEGFFAAGLDVLLTREPRPLVAAVGPATEEALRARGVEVELVAEPATGQDLARQLDVVLPQGAAVLVPRGCQPGVGLEPELLALERPFEALEVYENVEPPIPALEPFPVAAVFVAAPSAARRLLGRMPWMVDVPFLAIGHTTAHALRSLGVGTVLGPFLSRDQHVATLEAAWLRACASDNPPSPR